MDVEPVVEPAGFVAGESGGGATFGKDGVRLDGPARDVPPVYGEGNESGYGLDPARGLQEALDVWRREIARGRELCAGRPLEQTGRLADGPMAGAEVSLRWVLLHMIEEYARHNGHADILRERIDGVTGA
ncbi:DUF664 domain-containing protein [Streptomyces sp. NPDC057403]|uniref:mycothiol transferase n=1 Tax=Streptomyces sp. NPDC057403 TaxID=3346119 RepID=UPI003684CDA0